VIYIVTNKPIVRVKFLYETQYSDFLGQKIATHGRHTLPSRPTLPRDTEEPKFRQCRNKAEEPSVSLANTETRESIRLNENTKAELPIVPLPRTLKPGPMFAAPKTDRLEPSHRMS
jgi:hypothetical protein